MSTPEFTKDELRLIARWSEWHYVQATPKRLRLAASIRAKLVFVLPPARPEGTP